MLALTALSSSFRQTGVYRNTLRPILKRLVGVGAAPQPVVPASDVPSVTTSVFFPRPASLPDPATADGALLKRISEHKWYHTLDLGDGIITPGFYDHTPALGLHPLPKDLTGKRCLDVASFDGFWAFEMERRGAAEVVALDIDSWLDLDLPDYYKQSQLLERTGPVLQTGEGFKLAHERLKSKVERRICNVYNLSPKDFGEFDVVFCGDLLLHLTNPLHAMQRIFSVTKGEAYFMEPYIPSTVGQGPIIFLDADLSDCHWWRFGHDFLEKAARSAGFTNIDVRDDIDVRTRTYPQQPVPRVILRARP